MYLKAIKKILFSPERGDDYADGTKGFLEFAYREKNPKHFLFYRFKFLLVEGDHRLLLTWMRVLQR